LSTQALGNSRNKKKNDKIVYQGFTSFIIYLQGNPVEGQFHLSEWIADRCKEKASRKRPPFRQNTHLCSCCQITQKEQEPKKKNL